MNKEEALKRDLDTKNYIEKNKLRALFSELTRQVLLKRPQNPISYLIDYIEKRNKRSILCIQGYDEQKRTRLATSLANKFNFHQINLNNIFGGEQYHFRSNKQICDRVIQELSNVDKVYRGVIISGFPNNAYQADAIQKAGIIPQRYFLLYNDQPAVRQSYLKKHSEEESDILMDRNALQLKQLKEILGGQADQLPLIPQKALEKLTSTVSIRFKKVTPLQAPRVVVMHPPYLIPKTLNTLVQKYSFHWISLQNSFKKASKKEEFTNYVGAYVRQHKSLSKQIQLALIETESKTSAAKNKGILISGWPFRKQSLPFLKQNFINPHLIIIFTSIRQKAVQQFSKLDPNDSSLFSIVEKPTLQHYKAQLKDYENLVDGLKGQTNCQLLPITQNEPQVIKTFESLIQNPKIYS